MEVEGPTEVVGDFTEVVGEVSTAAGEVSTAAVVADFMEVAVEVSMLVAGLIVEAASLEARDLSEEEVLTEAEAFVAHQRRVITERAGVRTADSVHGAA